MKLTWGNMISEKSIKLKDYLLILCYIAMSAAVIRINFLYVKTTDFYLRVNHEIIRTKGNQFPDLIDHAYDINTVALCLVFFMGISILVIQKKKIYEGKILNFLWFLFLISTLISSIILRLS